MLSLLAKFRNRKRIKVKLHGKSWIDEVQDSPGHWKPLEDWSRTFEPPPKKKELSERKKKRRAKIKAKVGTYVRGKIETGVSLKLTGLSFEILSRLLNNAERNVKDKTVDVELMTRILNTANAIVLTFRFDKKKKYRKQFQYLRRVASDQLTDLLIPACSAIDHDKVQEKGEAATVALKELEVIVKSEKAFVRSMLESRIDEIIFSANQRLDDNIDQAEVNVASKLDGKLDEAFSSVGFTSNPFKLNAQETKKDEQDDAPLSTDLKSVEETDNVDGTELVTKDSKSKEPAKDVDNKEKKDVVTDSNEERVDPTIENGLGAKTISNDNVASLDDNPPLKDVKDEEEKSQVASPQSQAPNEGQQLVGVENSESETAAISTKGSIATDEEVAEPTQESLGQIDESKDVPQGDENSPDPKSQTNDDQEKETPQPQSSTALQQAVPESNDNQLVTPIAPVESPTEEEKTEIADEVRNETSDIWRQSKEQEDIVANSSGIGKPDSNDNDGELIAVKGDVEKEDGALVESTVPVVEEKEDTSSHFLQLIARSFSSDSGGQEAREELVGKVPDRTSLKSAKSSLKRTKNEVINTFGVQVRELIVAEMEDIPDHLLIAFKRVISVVEEAVAVSSELQEADEATLKAKVYSTIEDIHSKGQTQVSQEVQKVVGLFSGMMVANEDDDSDDDEDEN